MEKISFFEEADFKHQTPPEHTPEIRDSSVDWESLGVELREKEFSPELLKLIVGVNEWLREDFHKLGIKKEYQNVDPLTVHFIEKSDVLEKAGLQNAAGFFIVPTGREDHLFLPGHIYVLYDPDPMNLAERLAHEMIHRASKTITYHEALFSSEESEQKLKSATYRSGYDITDIRDDDPTKRSKLRGFNEAVVEYSALEFLYDKQDEINKVEGKMRMSEVLDKYGSYRDYIDVLIKILSFVGENDGPKMLRAWEKIRKGLYEGSLMNLREIAKAFPNTPILERLSMMGIDRESDPAIINLISDTIKFEKGLRDNN